MALKSHYSSGVREAGCDEAGRGCLAGRVFAAAVVLPLKWDHPWLNDSKMLREDQRYAMREYIETEALDWALGWCEPEEIDQYNILQCSIHAMHRAITGLKKVPESLIIDGNRFKPYPGIPHTCIVRGDSLYRSIAAASILAKTARDDYMKELHTIHPEYGWLDNKGYPTSQHREALLHLGPTPYHRVTFRVEGMPISNLTSKIL